MAELEREGAGGKFTLAEVEENEAGLTKVRHWLRRVRARDLFDCDARWAAEAAVNRAEEQLALFTEQAVARESGVAGGSTSADPTLRVISGDS